MSKLIIFDLDGTLLDTVADLGAAVDWTLAEHGLPGHTEEEYRRMVGGGVRKLVESAMLPVRDDALFIDCLDGFFKYYLANIDVHTRAYDGVPELLAELAADGCKLAVASNKFQAGTEKLVRSFFPGIPFCAVYGNREGFPLKPDAALVEEIMGLAGVGREDTVMVGDSATDINTAINGGIRAVAVSWGFKPREELAAASVIVDTAAELREVLKKNS